MKKFIHILCAVALALSLTACSKQKSPIEVGEYYFDCMSQGKMDEFYKEHASELYFELYVGKNVDRDAWYNDLRESGQQGVQLREKLNRTFVLKGVEIVKEYTSDELKTYNKTYGENFKDMVLVNVSFDLHKDNVLEKEDSIQLLLAKQDGKWAITRYM